MIVVPKETPSGTKVDVINADNSGFGNDYMLVLDSVEVCVSLKKMRTHTRRKLSVRVVCVCIFEAPVRT